MSRKVTFVFAVMLMVMLTYTRKLEVTWTRDQRFNDVIKVTGYPHLELPAHSVIHCASLCTSNSSCSSCFFLPTTRRCLLNELVFARPNGGQSSADARYYMAAVSDCSSSDGYVLLRKQRMCIKVYRKRTNFTSAYKNCLNDGSRLVVLDTEAKKTAVEGYFADGRDLHWIAYVGAAREGVIDGTRNTWKTSHHPLYWLNRVKVATKKVKSWWAIGNPSNSNGKEGCMVTTSTKWNDVPCKNKYPYICEKVLN